VGLWGLSLVGWQADRQWPGWPVGGALVGCQVVIWQDWGSLEGWQAGGSPPILSVYHDVKKLSTS
jgi:hypothetical protein